MPDYDWEDSSAGSDLFTTAPWSHFRETIKNVIIADGVTSIGVLTCVQHTNITNINIPKSVTIIKNYAFTNCKNLATITIPASVAEIGYNSFAICTSLLNVTCLAVTPPELGDEDNFSSVTDDVLHVPAGSVAAYKADSDWSGAFGSIVAIE